MGNPVTTRIITGKFGVSCLPACDGLITTFFSLYCTDIVPPHIDRGTGGSIPLPPGAIKDFYQVVDAPYLIPRDQEWRLLEKGKVVNLELKIGEKIVEKTYKVPEERRSMIVNVLSVVNTTKERMNITIKKVTTVATGAAVRVFNLRKVK